MREVGSERPVATVLALWSRAEIMAGGAGAGVSRCCDVGFQQSGEHHWDYCSFVFR